MDIGNARMGNTGMGGWQPEAPTPLSALAMAPRCSQLGLVPYLESPGQAQAQLYVSKQY